MKHRSRLFGTLRSYLIAGILMASVIPAFGQVEFGVDLNSSRNGSFSGIQPNQYRKMGISHFIVDSRYIRYFTGGKDTGSVKRIHILAAPPLQFLTAYDLKKHKTLLKKRLFGPLPSPGEEIRPDGYGVFQLSETGSAELLREITPMVLQLKDSVRAPVFYIRQFSQKDIFAHLFDFSLLQINEHIDPARLHSRITAQTRGICFDPADEDFYDQAYLQTLFQTVREDSGLVLYLDGKWLSAALTSHPQFRSILTSYATNPRAVFGNPVAHPPPARPGYAVLILLLIWLIIAIHYGFEPNYRKSLFRYFGYHRFFIGDIVQRVLRFTHSNVLILVIQALIGSLFIYSCLHFFTTGTGFRAIGAHYPLLGFSEGLNLRLLSLAFIGVLVFNLAGSLWIYVSSPDFSQYGQVLTLYLWPQHLNLLVISLLITFTATYQSPYLVYICGILYVLVLLSSFIVAGTDIYNHSSKKIFFLFKTIFPYLALVIFILSWIIGNTGIVAVWRLATSLT